jgi:hypothetical protein
LHIGTDWPLQPQPQLLQQHVMVRPLVLQQERFEAMSWQPV